MGLNEGNSRFPMVFIQPDWHDTLMVPGNRVWISYKFRESPSEHGKVVCLSENSSLKFKSSEGFVVKVINPLTLELNLPLIKHKAILVAPSSSYSNIHSKAMTCFDVTTKGLVVSSGSDGKLMLWNSDKEGKKVQLELEGHEGEVYKCMFFPSEKVVLSCGSDMSLRIWCALTGRCPVRLVGHTQPVTDCTIIEKGRNVLSVSKDGSAKLWNCGTAECLGDIIKVPSIINCCTIDEAPPSINLGMPNRQLSEKEVGTENKILLVGCEDGSVHCASLQARVHIFTITIDSPVNSVAFLPKNRFVIGAQDGKVIEYSISEGVPEIIIERHDSNSAVLKIFSPMGESQGRYYVSRADGTVSLISGDSSQSILLTGSNCDPVYHIGSNSRYIFTCCRDGVLRAYLSTNIDKLISNK